MNNGRILSMKWVGTEVTIADLSSNHYIALQMGDGVWNSEIKHYVNGGRYLIAGASFGIMAFVLERNTQ